MRRNIPCKILEKYGNNAYKIDLLEDIALSPTFYVIVLITYKGHDQEDGNEVPIVVAIISKL